MQSDANQAAQDLTRAYLALAMFLFALIAFQLVMGESLGVARTREDQPIVCWTVLGVQTAAFVLVSSRSTSTIASRRSNNRSLGRGQAPESSAQPNYTKRTLIVGKSYKS